MDFQGFSDLFQISLISSNQEGYVVYAYNNAFFNLYGHSKPESNLIIEDLTIVENCQKLDYICSS